MNDKPDGIGVLKNDGYVYEGKWKGGRRHGHGKVKFPDQQGFVEVEYQVRESSVFLLLWCVCVCVCCTHLCVDV
jgi:MORN repeat